MKKGEAQEARLIEQLDCVKLELFNHKKGGVGKIEATEIQLTKEFESSKVEIAKLEEGQELEIVELQGEVALLHAQLRRRACPSGESKTPEPDHKASQLWRLHPLG